MWLIWYFMGFPGDSVVKKKSACQCRRCKRLGFDPWSRKIPWSRKWLTPVFLPGKFYGQRSLVGYSPWGCGVGHDWACTCTHTHTHTHSTLPLKHPKLQSKHENIRSPKSDILQNIWPVLLNTVKAIKNKENLRHCHSQEEPEETWQLHVIGPCKARIN